MTTWRRLWHRWKRTAEVIANFQSRVILSLFYFLVVLPFGVMVRLLGDPLGIRRKTGSAWSEFVERARTVEEGKRQF